MLTNTWRRSTRCNSGYCVEARLGSTYPERALEISPRAWSAFIDWVKSAA